MLVLSISVAVFDGVAGKGDGRMFLLTWQVQGYQQELLGCPCNHRQQWGWVRAALHPLVSCWDVGARCAPAPGILQGNRVVRGSSGRGEGCAACAQPLPVPSPCLLPSLHPQPCPWPGAAQPLVSVPWQMCWGRALCGNHSMAHLPDAFPVLQLAGELWADHLLPLVDKAARLPKANCGDHAVSGWKNSYTVFSC